VGSGFGGEGRGRKNGGVHEIAILSMGGGGSHLEA